MMGIFNCNEHGTFSVEWIEFGDYADAGCGVLVPTSIYYLNQSRDLKPWELWRKDGGNLI